MAEPRQRDAPSDRRRVRPVAFLWVIAVEVSLWVSMSTEVLLVDSNGSVEINSEFLYLAFASTLP